MNNIYKDIEEYNPIPLIADMLTNKKLNDNDNC